MNQQQSPPLIIWLWTVLAIAAFLLVKHFAFKKANIENTSPLSPVTYEKENDIQYHGHVYKILVFGSSRMASATSELTDFNKSLTHKRIPVDVKFFSTPNAGFEYFLANTDLYVQIRKYKPDLILLQSDLVLYEAKGDIAPRKSDSNRLKMVLDGKEDPGRFKAYTPEEDRWSPKLDSTKYHSNSKYFFQKNTLREVPFNNTILKSLVESLIGKGVEIVAIDIPYPVPIEVFKADNGYSKKEAVIWSQLKEHYNIDLWPNKDPYYFKDYHDFVHMNSSGKIKYSEWLKRQIESYIDSK